MVPTEHSYFHATVRTYTVLFEVLRPSLVSGGGNQVADLDGLQAGLVLRCLTAAKRPTNKPPEPHERRVDGHALWSEMPVGMEPRQIHLELLSKTLDKLPSVRAINAQITKEVRGRGQSRAFDPDGLRHEVHYAVV